MAKRGYDKSKYITQLYRHYDAEGVLLYVGISLSAVSRLSAHSKLSPWVLDIATIKVVNFPTRKLALEAEEAAIRNEKPLYNKAGNAGRVSIIDDMLKQLPAYQYYKESGRPPYLITVKGRDKKPRTYFRFQDYKLVPLTKPYGSDEFYIEYMTARMRVDPSVEADLKVLRGLLQLRKEAA